MAPLPSAEVKLKASKMYKSQKIVFRSLYKQKNGSTHLTTTSNAGEATKFVNKNGAAES